MIAPTLLARGAHAPITGDGSVWMAVGIVAVLVVLLVVLLMLTDRDLRRTSDELAKSKATAKRLDERVAELTDEAATARAELGVTRRRLTDAIDRTWQIEAVNASQERPARRTGDAFEQIVRNIWNGKEGPS